MFEDRQLVDRLKHGDRDALCRIYRKYGDSLLTLAAGIVRDRGLAEDILHDVFLEFVRDIDAFELTGGLKCYLARCVANRAIDLLRSRKNHSAHLSHLETVGSEMPPPPQAAVRREELRQLAEAMDQLPEEQRQVILMHVHGRMGYRQIALCQGVSINTIQGRYRYGMKKLKTVTP